MTSTLGFWISLGATVALLVVALLSGWTGRRRLHLLSAPLCIVGLVVAVWFTEQLVRSYDFPGQLFGWRLLDVHLFFAIGGAALAAPVVVTGIGLCFLPRLRTMHRLAVFAFLAFVLIAAGTGIWSFCLAVPKPA